MVVVRLYIRHSAIGDLPLGWDDTATGASWIAILPLPVLSGLLSQQGIGKDIWDVPLNDLYQFYLLFYAWAISYTTAVVK